MKNSSSSWIYRPVTNRSFSPRCTTPREANTQSVSVNTQTFKRTFWWPLRTKRSEYKQRLIADKADRKRYILHSISSSCKAVLDTTRLFQLKASCCSLEVSGVCVCTLLTPVFPVLETCWECLLRVEWCSGDWNGTDWWLDGKSRNSTNFPLILLDFGTLLGECTLNNLWHGEMGEESAG